MEVQPSRPSRKYHVKKSRNRLTKSFIEECKALQERILQRRHGELLPSSVDDIRDMREGRLR